MKPEDVGESHQTLPVGVEVWERDNVLPNIQLLITCSMQNEIGRLVMSISS